MGLATSYTPQDVARTTVLPPKHVYDGIVHKARNLPTEEYRQLTAIRIPSPGGDNLIPCSPSVLCVYGSEGERGDQIQVEMDNISFPFPLS